MFSKLLILLISLLTHYPIDLAVDVSCVDAIHNPVCTVVVENYRGVSYNVRASILYSMPVSAVSASRGIITDMERGEVKWLVGTSFTVSTIATATITFDRVHYGPFELAASVWSTRAEERDMDESNNEDAVLSDLSHSWLPLTPAR